MARDKVHDLRVVVGGIGFPEGLRWHDGALWFSDFHRRWVCSVHGSGRLTDQVYVGGQPSGLGWLADGTMLVSSMHDRRVLRVQAGRLRVHAELAQVLRGQANELITDATGRAYVGSFGYDHGEDTSEVHYSAVAAVEPDGSVRIVTPTLRTPNGMALSRDGRQLVVVETLEHRLNVFDVDGDGGLSNRRTFAVLDGRRPDGICMDVEGAVWAACLSGEEGCVRVAPGGEILEFVPTPGRWSIACTLGGPEQRTLFVGTCRTDIDRSRVGSGEGAIEAVQVHVPGY